MPYKNYIPLDPGKMYFNTPDGLVPLGDVQEVEITEETDLDILGRPGPVRIVQPEQEFTASITLNEEATEALRRLKKTVEKAWKVITDVMARLVMMLDNYPNRCVVHLARHHRDPLVRKKNAKRIARYYKKHKER